MATFYSYYNPLGVDRSGYETDPEFELDESEPEPQYNIMLRDAAIEKAYRRQFKTNLPRKEGHYKLQTRIKNFHDEAIQVHYYDGNHWEVDGRYHSDSDPEEQAPDEFTNRPLQLERTTLRLTVNAVQTAMDIEKKRRLRKIQQTGEHCLKVMAPLNRELVAIVKRNEDALNKEKNAFGQQMGDAKDDFMIELTRKHADQEIEREFGEEQHRRLEFYEEATDCERKDPEHIDRMTSLAKNAQIWQNLQCELTGAFGDLDEVHQEEDHAVGDLFQELKDEFIQSFKKATNLMKLHMSEEKERRRRLNEARSLASGQTEIDSKRKQSMLHKSLIEEELNRQFAGVTEVDAFEVGVGLGKTQHDMDQALEGLVRTVAGKKVDQACADERAQRLVDIQEEIQYGSADSFKEALKDAMVDIQEQMLLMIFHGHKVKTPQRQTVSQRPSKGETEQDRMRRAARMKSRRQSCVVTDF